MNQSITLYSQKDGADKAYQIVLEAKDGGFIVTGYNGRRGGALKAQPKTASPLPYTEAKQAYDALLKSKLKGGYQPSDAGSAYESPIDVGTSIDIALHLLTQGLESDIERYLTNDRYLAQEKHDGERRPVARRETVIGGNKNGFQVPMPKVMVEALSHLEPDTEIDAEQVGDTLFVFDAIKSAGQSLRSVACLERMQIVNALIKRLGNPPNVVAVETAFGTAAKRALYTRLRAQCKEGIVFKRIDAAYGIGKNDDQIKVKFVEQATLQVASHHPTKRSITVQAFNDEGKAVPLGAVTIPANRPIPAVREIIEVQYLYLVSSLVQAVYLGVRTDQTLAACAMSQLKRKTDIDENDSQNEDAQLAA